ncbi:MAG: indole-3-glycerol phosphate synthase TrpC [Crocinitomicaceae bacterium]|nr:indole-3-glycerol phosphate synthase TrpC [Crocinitomicaceae bacterium]
MKTILDTIVDVKRKEVEELRKNFTYYDYEKSPLFESKCTSLKQSIVEQEFAIIAEIKRKSPSAGIIDFGINFYQQAAKYDQANVAGISCLTDHYFFGGTVDDLKQIKASTSTPLLRKDFIIDEIQLFEAKAFGADAILLISEILDPKTALQLTIIAQSLGMEVLMECHDRTHLRKINDQVDIIGINNRDLHLQKTDLQTSYDLFDFIPSDTVCISESGVRNYDEILKLSKIGYNGVLIGESILKQSDPAEFIRSIQLKKMSHAD